MTVLDYDSVSAAIQATERARLADMGLTPSFADGQIAAIAISHQLILVTRNTKDFKKFSALLVENWFESGAG